MVFSIEDDIIDVVVELFDFLFSSNLFLQQIKMESILLFNVRVLIIHNF